MLKYFSWLMFFLCWSFAQELELSGDIQRIHDPAIAEKEGNYYVFSTGVGISVSCSPDMLVWDLCKAVFFGYPDWLEEKIPDVGDLWAPDISFYNGKYQVYYAASTFGQNRSAIGLATNTTLDINSENYKWQDEGLVIESFPSDNWNAIDPNFVLDENGQPWLAFGSYWSGIKLIKLDPATRKPSTEDTTLYSLAYRPPAPHAVEAPFIIYKNGFYYLFVSFDQCCRGANSTYHTRVGRSETITGRYVDKDGVPMLEGGGTLVLEAGERWKGPGHNAIIQKDGEDFIVYHAYDAELNGAFSLQIAPLEWVDGWPTVQK
jgi:arabinan endo-1,5-alpha-L-arabinosidase